MRSSYLERFNKKGSVLYNTGLFFMCNAGGRVQFYKKNQLNFQKKLPFPKICYII